MARLYPDQLTFEDLYDVLKHFVGTEYLRPMVTKMCRAIGMSVSQFGAQAVERLREFDFTNLYAIECHTKMFEMLRAVRFRGVDDVGYLLQCATHLTDPLLTQTILEIRAAKGLTMAEIAAHL